MARKQLLSVLLLDEEYEEFLCGLETKRRKMEYVMRGIESALWLSEEGNSVVLKKVRINV